ncbi:MAG: NUDIX domain-containing protein [Defluviitaleaceae bacterium]|nr:NUDIX domain-containing protein [Defluviitaleaceae bacterium]
MNLLKQITDKELFGIDGHNYEEPYKAARAVLLDDNNLVAVLYLKKLNFYTLPGGGIDVGETMQQALAREMQEETGCYIDIVCELGIIEENSLIYNWSGASSCFIAKTKGEKGLLHLTQEEIDQETQVHWYNIHEALEIIINQNISARDEREAGIVKFIQKRDIVLLNEAIKMLKT